MGRSGAALRYRCSRSDTSLLALLHIAGTQGIDDVLTKSWATPRVRKRGRIGPGGGRWNGEEEAVYAGANSLRVGRTESGPEIEEYYEVRECSSYLKAETGNKARES